jgi:hypothetical protein
MAAHLPGLGETGRTGGGITTSQEQLGDSPYTVYYYEATGPENPEDATIDNIRPLDGGIVLSTTFTCETEPPEEEDTTPPDVEITGVVDRSGREITDGSGRTPIPYIQITFEATDAVGIDETECSLDGQPFTPCTSPVAYDRLSRDTHEFTVRVTDNAGNTGEDEFAWTVGNNPSAAAPGRQ